MGFPLRDKITGGYPIIMKFTLHLYWRRIENAFQTRSKSHIFSLRMELPFRFILNFSECTKLQQCKMCIWFVGNVRCCHHGWTIKNWNKFHNTLGPGTNGDTTFIRCVTCGNSLISKVLTINSGGRGLTNPWGDHSIWGGFYRGDQPNSILL